MITLQAVKAQVHYDPDTGIFTRLACRRTDRIGERADYLDSSNGYRKVSLNNRRYFGHRLAWFYIHGCWPPDQIDHINRDRADNRLINLRLATNGQNYINGPARRHGLKGASFHKRAGKWCSQINRQYLGLFDTELEAHEAYCQMAKELYGEFATDAVPLGKAPRPQK